LALKRQLYCPYPTEIAYIVWQDDGNIFEDE